MSLRNSSRFSGKLLTVLDVQYVKQTAEMDVYRLRVGYQLKTAYIVDNAMIFRMAVLHIIQSEIRMEMES